jgi:outer membrane protein OmpA-like peptidoglycan-associated protein
LEEAEQSSERLSGQIEELSTISNAARGGAKAAQETADRAMAGLSNVNDRINRTNERIGELDDYRADAGKTVLFKAGSWTLTEEAMAELDRLAEDLKLHRGYLVEVRGFASSDGSESWNRVLSMRRAESVVRYLAESHDIPLRRIIMPHGFGEKMPVADNKSRMGREQNRRVEVRILVNNGIVQSAELSMQPQ